MKNNRACGDYRHLKSLVEQWLERNFLLPFLVINVFSCIHDYRRMGVPYKNYRIPKFNSLLRTVIIDLRKIPDFRNMIEDESFKLTVSKEIIPREQGETPQRYIDRISAKELFKVRVSPGNIQVNEPILTIDELCAQVEKLR